MINSLEQIEGIFREIDRVVQNKVKVFTIGGAVLVEQGLKTSTKDIDLIVETKEEFMDLQEALIEIGFQLKIPGEAYSHMNLSQIFQRGDYRIDLFEKEVCSKFSLSKKMMERARKVINLNKVEIFFCSNEDIFLFKTMTEREGDLADCENIVRAAVDWKIIVEELKRQIQDRGQDVWITWVGERLDLLEERGMIIPIMKEINRLRIKFFKDFEKKVMNK